MVIETIKKENNMTGWIVFFVICFLIGTITTNFSLLKRTEKMKLPDSVLKEIEERKLAKQAKAQEIKKPTDN